MASHCSPVQGGATVMQKGHGQALLSLPSWPDKVSACLAHCLGFNENPSYRLFLYIMYHFFFHSNV